MQDVELYARLILVLNFPPAGILYTVYTIQYIIIMQDEELYARLILVLNFPPAGILYTVYSI